MDDACCLNCKERKYKCHVTCERYLNFKDKLEKIKQVKTLESIRNAWTHTAIKMRGMQIRKGKK